MNTKNKIAAANVRFPLDVFFFYFGFMDAFISLDMQNLTHIRGFEVYFEWLRHFIS